LIAEIERRCGRRLPLASLFQNATAEHMAAQLRQRGNAPRREAPVAIQPRGSKQPFFCVHPAGGTVFCYLELAAALGPDQPFYGLQARGLDGEQAPHETVQEMAASYIELMRQVQPTGPYLLGGWSLGGNLAYEMARLLEAQGEKVELLALFDAGAMPPDEPAAEEDFLPVIMGMFPDGPQVSLEELRKLPPAEQLNYFLERAQHAMLVTPGDSQMQAQGVFDVFQANLRAMLAWRPAEYHGKVTLFRAEEQATKLADDATLGSVCLRGRSPCGAGRPCTHGPPAERLGLGRTIAGLPGGVASSVGGPGRRALTRFVRDRRKAVVRFSLG
jgi:thioesterase domain-containing protein